MIKYLRWYYGNRSKQIIRLKKRLVNKEEALRFIIEMENKNKKKGDEQMEVKTEE